MARADRLMRLLDTIRRLPPPVTAARLAQDMEISERTLYRDIQTLRAGGALIDGEPGLGYTLTEDPALPPQMFSQIEVEALVLGLSEVRLAGDPALARAAELALAKIKATLPDRVQRQAIHAVSHVYRMEARPPAPAHMALLRQAAWEERAVDMTYRDLSGELTSRRIWPLAIVFLDRTLICLAWCCLRQDYRRFHLGAMSDVCLTAESYRPRRVTLLREFIAKMQSSDQRPA